MPKYRNVVVCFVACGKDSLAPVCRDALSSFRTNNRVISIIMENPVITVYAVHGTLEMMECLCDITVYNVMYLCHTQSLDVYSN